MTGYAQALAGFLTAVVWLAPGLASWAGVPAAAPEPQVIRRTLQWPAGTREHALELSNITGAVTIVGEDRADVSVIATRTVTRQGAADDPGPTPDFRQQTDALLVCGDARRCGCHVDSSKSERWYDDDRTRVRTEFEVHVPRAITLDVCTVNGDLIATLTTAPHDSSEFRTVNGRVSVTLPASLSADLRLRTVHGGIYTDFETTQLPSRGTTDRRNGRFVYRSDRYASVRVGSGGPELRLETVNGDVQVRKK